MFGEYCTAPCGEWVSQLSASGYPPEICGDSKSRGSSGKPCMQRFWANPGYDKGHVLWFSCKIQFMVVFSTFGLTTQCFNLVARTTVPLCYRFVEVWWWWTNSLSTSYWIWWTFRLITVYPPGGDAKSKCWFKLCKKEGNQTRCHQYAKRPC